MADESLLTPALQAQVGVRSEPIPVVIDVPAVQRTVETYGGKRRRVRVGEPAPAAVLIALEALTRVQLATDLSGPGQISHELSVERPLIVGERLALTVGIGRIIERFGGRFGPHLQVRSETELLDENGKVVARTARTDAWFDGRPRPEGMSPDPPLLTPVNRPPYVRRPSASIEAGDELPVLTVFATLADNIRCCALTWSFFPAFLQAIYRTDGSARAIPLMGALRLLYLFRAAEEWLDDGGYVRAVRVAYRNPVLVGMGVERHGRVTRVYEDGGARFAEVEQVGLDGAGGEVDRGFATVQLLG